MNITFEFACQDDCLDKMVPSDLRKIVAERDALLEAIETALHGTKLDDCGNRDDDGLVPWGSKTTATRVLHEALLKYAKAGAL